MAAIGFADRRRFSTNATVLLAKFYGQFSDLDRAGQR